MKRPFSRGRHLHSFTLVELLVVLAIIALLASLMQPAFKSAIAKAQSLTCTANLRTIGTAVSLAAADNNNLLPEIDQAATPIYSPPGSVGGLASVLGPYGVSTNVTQCPVDMASGSSSFSLYGSSYEWDPVFDEENPLTPVVYNTRSSATKGFAINPSRVRLCYDFNGVHKGRINSDGTTTYQRNVLYGDGHVSSH